MIFFILFFLFQFSCGQPHFSHLTEQLRYALDTKDANVLMFSASELVPVLKELAQKPFDRSSLGEIEGLYSTVKMIGEVPVLPLYKQWLIYYRQNDLQKFFDAQQVVFNQLFPFTSLLRNQVIAWEQSFEERKKEGEKSKKQLVLDTQTDMQDYLLKAHLFHFKVERSFYRGQYSRFSSSLTGSTHKTGLWFDSNQASMLSVLQYSFDAHKPSGDGVFGSELSRKIWNRSAILLIDHLVVLHQMRKENLKVAALPQFQFLYEHKVASFVHHLEGPVLMKLLFMSSGLVDKNSTAPLIYLTTLEKVTRQLFCLYQDIENKKILLPEQKVFLLKVLRFNAYTQKNFSIKFDDAWSLENKNKWTQVNYDFRSNVDEISKIFNTKKIS